MDGRDREKHRPLANAIVRALTATDDMPYIGDGSDADDMVGVRIDGYFDVLEAAEKLQQWIDESEDAQGECQ